MHMILVYLMTDDTNFEHLVKLMYSRFLYYNDTLFSFVITPLFVRDWDVGLSSFS